MANGGNIQYGISFKVDTSNLKQINEALDNLSFQISNIQQRGNIKADLSGLLPMDKVNEFRVALDRAYNPKLDTYNIKTFANEIRKSTISAQELKTAFSQGGQVGVRAYENVAMQILKTEKEIIKTNKFLDEMATSFSNTIKWGISSGVFNKVTSSISEAYNYTKRLDKSLNDIRIVTGKSADEMERFAKVANKAAYELGSSTKEYTDAALIYYQQGDDNATAQAKANTTLKAANVTGQDAGAVSEQLTAVWNGFNVTAGQTEAVVDKLAAVAATTASDLEELSTGMSKVASAANTMGVDIDQLSAQMSTIISVTRQAPESVGTALKTIFARMGDLQVDGVDEFGVTLGEVSGKMQTMGINVVDETGNLRDMGVVIEEVAKKWDTWTESQKTAAAVAMAGKRQYNNLFALFENWGMYEEALETSKNALGTLEEQNNIYLDSVDGRLTQLQNKWEELYSGIFKADEIKPVISLMESLVEVFTRFTKATGGGVTSLLAFGSVLTGVFSKQLGKFTAGQIQKKVARTENEKSLKTKADIYNIGIDKENSESYKKGLENAKKLDRVSPYLSEEQRASRKEKIFQAYELEANVEARQYQDTQKAQKQIDINEKEQEELIQKTDKNEEDLARLETLKQQTEELKKQVELVNSFYETPTQSRSNYNEYIQELNKKGGYIDLNGIRYDDELDSLDTSRIKSDIDRLEKIKNNPEELDKERDKRKEVLNEDLKSSIGKSGELEEQLIEKKGKTIKGNSTEAKRKRKELQEEIKSIEDKIKKEKKYQDEKRKELKLYDKEERIVEDINEEIKKKEKLIQDAEKMQKKMNNAAEVEGDSVKADALNKELSAEEELDETMIKRASTVELLTNGVSALTMSWAALNSVYQIWADTDASPWEKIGNTVLTLGMQLPMIISQFGNLKNALMSIKAVQEASLLLEQKSILENIKKLGLQGQELTNEGLIAIAQKLGLEVEEEITEEDKRQLLLEQVKQVLAKKGLALKGTEIVQEGVLQKTALGTALTKIAGAASNPYTLPLAIAAAAIIGVGIAAAGSAKATEQEKIEQNDKIIEEEQSNQEELIKQDEAYSKMLDLNKQYEEGTITKEELQKQTSDLIKEYELEGAAIDRLIAGYGDYEDAVRSAQAEQQKAIADSAYREAEAAASNLESKNIWSEGKGREEVFGTDYTVDVSSASVDSASKEFLTELKAQMTAQGLDFDGEVTDGGNIDFAPTAENFKKFIEAIRATNENVSEEARLSEFGLGFQTQVEKFGEYVDTLINAEEKEKEAKIKESVYNDKDFDENMTSAEYMKKEKAQIEKWKKEGASEEDIEKWTGYYRAAAQEQASDAVTLSVQKEAAEQYMAEEGFTNFKQTDEYKESEKNRNQNFINTLQKQRTADENGQYEYDEMIQNNWGGIKGGWQDWPTQEERDEVERVKNEYFNELTQLISEGKYDEAKALYTNGKSYATNKGEGNDMLIKGGTENEFDKLWTSRAEHETVMHDKYMSDGSTDNLGIEEWMSSLESFKDEQQQTILNAGMEKIKEYTALYQEGRTDDEARKMAMNRIIFEAEIKVNEDTLASLDDLKGALSSGKILTEEQTEALKELEKKYPQLAEIRDKTSERYLDQLEQVKDAIEEENIAIAEQAYDFTIAADIDTDNVKESIDAIIDADYKVIVAIEADIQSDFDNIANKLEEIDGLASKIGKDFEVSAEDLNELGTAFPGILENVQFFTDGTTQLNAEATKAAIENIKAEMLAEKDKALLENEANRKKVQEKIAITKTLIGITKNAIDNEIKGEEYASQIESVLNTLKKEDIEALSNITTTNSEATTKTEADNAVEVSKNYQSAYAAAADASAKFAEIAIKNGQAIIEGDVGKIITAEGKKAFTEEMQKAEVSAPEVVDSAELLDAETYANVTETGEQFQILSSLEYELEALENLENTINNNDIEIKGRYNQALASLNNAMSGKGSGGSSSDPNQEDYIDGEIDKFHDLEKAIQRTEDALDRLTTAEERAFGQDLIDNLDAQLENLAGQTALQEKKKDLAIQEAAVFQTSLASQGVAFDEEGTITNYQSIIAEKINATNKIIEAYNSMSASEQEANEETVNKAKEDLEKFQEEIEKYEEYIYDTIPEIQSRIDEIMDEKVEINVKKLNIEVDLRMKIIDSKDAFRTFKTQVLDGLKEGMLGYAESTLTGIQGMFGSTLDAINADYKNLQLVQSEIQKMQKGETSNVFGNNMQVALEELENIQNRLIENMTSYYELQEEANETYNAALDKLQEMLDLQQELYSNLNDIFEHGKELSALLYGEDDWVNRLAFDTEQFNVLKNALVDSNTALEESKKRLDELEEGTVEWYEEQERYNTLLQQTNDLEAQALEKAKEVRNDGVEKTLQSIEKNLFGGLSFKDAKEKWEKLKEESDKYFDSIERDYQMDTLERSFNKAISQNNLNLKAQKQLNQLKDEELKKLKEKENLSQYDVQRAQKLLDIEMARIALEEAQNNKSTLKLKRDAQGNYSYQYVANQDDIAEKEQNLADAENDLYQMDQEEYKRQIDEQYASYEEFANKMRELQDLGLAETEEFYRLLDEGYSTLMTNMINASTDMNTARTNLETTFFDTMTTEKIPQWAGDMEQMAFDHGVLESEIDSGTTEIEGYWTDAQAKMDEVSTLVNKDYGDIVGSTKTAASTTKDLSDKVNDLTEEYKEDVAQAKLVKNAIDEITKSQQAQITKVGQAIAKNQEFYEEIQSDAAEAASKITQSFGQMAVDVKSYLDQASSYAAQAVAEAKKAADAAKAAAGWNGDTTKNTGDTEHTSAKEKIKVMPAKGIENLTYFDSKDGSHGRTLKVNQGTNYVWMLTEHNGNRGLLKYTINGSETATGGVFGWVDLDELRLPNGSPLGFDTGGYTGDWNSSEGRMAWLHEKELVLNKTDTKNMLKAIELTRSMDDIINSLESSVVNRINRLTQQLNEMVNCINIKAKLKDTEQKLEQNVQIYADFPNVKGVDEIEQAFENLYNRATQYTFSTDRLY